MMMKINKRLANNKRSGFTLIELVVVIAILAILALIMVPNLTAYLGKAKEAKIDANMKNIHTAAEMVRQTEGGLDEDIIKTFFNNEDVIVSEGVIADKDLEADKYTVTNKGGQTLVKYKTQDGKVFTFPDVSNVNNGETGETGENEDPNYGDEYLATDDDFEWVKSPADFAWIIAGGEPYEAKKEEDKGFYQYKGDKTTVKIPHKINGHDMTSYYGMFAGTSVEKVISDNSNITDMRFMFYDSQATELDLSSFNTSNVTNMRFMFGYSQATTLDLSSFNTSNVTDMYGMFEDSQATELDLSSFDTSNVTRMDFMFTRSKATTLDLSSFDTSNVTNMWGMFRGSQATSLDLSSFDTSNVTNMRHMFQESQATSLDLSSFDTSKITNVISIFQDCKATIGYARTQADANRFNSSSPKPSGLTFEVKQP